ncbi:methyltransferase regulatory domain-containing protein [Candidatus Trichorickettsia mobilis]|uniref:methyltransferase regulatory domain-containing protein n=1 Tax=Candidatus Trichorickettsia mobilis TaxID=1346319 RepID=UPI00293147A3|nr:methyltransferase regulatory domain-containing protein [Candidatus Trichorickettsia mobilis]
MVNLEVTKVDDIGKSYDDVLYASDSYPQSSPYHLMTLGVLFGMKPVKPEQARVLELGCGIGGNLIPHAANYPEAEFVGVDLSKAQIDEANKHVVGLGLKNIKFHPCSITDIDESWGKFDYIIAHGLLSWVPEFVKNKIFEISSKNLSKNGIAYISYNTLPGWNMIRSIREMMLYHTRKTNDLREKYIQAKSFLDFMLKNMNDADSPYAKVIKKEVEILANVSDYYFMHEHLEENNSQYYFFEFMQKAKQNGLQYLSETDLVIMLSDNLPDNVAKILNQFNDFIEIQQYMDFITNRRFRTTLLCHNDVQLNRSININSIKQFKFQNCYFETEKNITNEDIINPKITVNFVNKDNSIQKITTIDPVMKAALCVLIENLRNPTSFSKLVEEANIKLGGNKNLEVIEKTLSDHLTGLVFQGHIQITLQADRPRRDLEKPKLSTFSLYQIRNSDNLWLTNIFHEKVVVNKLQKVMMSYMDGHNKKKDIVDLTISYVKANRISINNLSNTKITLSSDKAKNSLLQVLNDTIDSLNKMAVLV